jgi:G:T/U-mismatch repair DNA glycosylase
MKKSGKEPFKFVEDVRHENIIPYAQQTELFSSKGFALWDVVGECERKGSLDQDIKKEVPNDIRGFCQEHPHLKKIVFANGGTGSTMFLKHFRQWWLEGELKPGENTQSQTAFGKVDNRVKEHVDIPITCVSALSVSPAAAKYTYKMKRDFWDEFVYSPGLQFHKELQQSMGSPPGVTEF